MLALKNLYRRKGRTLLTALGIGIGVSAIIILGALADGMGGGYQSLITGSKADLVITQPNVLEISMSGIDEEIGDQFLNMSEVKSVSGMTQGIVTADELAYFFVFGYPKDSFILERFNIVEGQALNSRVEQSAKGRPIVLGKLAAEALKKEVGDTIRITTTVYRIIGIYETGSAFEDGGAVIELKDAQVLLGRQRQVNVIYIQLKDRNLQERVITRANRLWPDLDTITTQELADQQIMAGDAMEIFIIIIAGMAILIGGVGMANAQLMAVFERTREIGVLRAVGWSSRQILVLIITESVIVSFLGGIVGIIIGFAVVSSLSTVLVAFGATVETVSSTRILEAGIAVLILGVLGGYYPARKAANLKPIEALRYEGGGSGGTQKRFPIGGMAVQSLWQRSTRTLLTLGLISLTVGSIIALDVMVEGMKEMIGGLATQSGGEIMLRQANVSDTSQSVIDMKDIKKISSLPEVQSASGLVFTAATMPETLFFLVQGYELNNFAIKRYKIVEGEPLSSNHQIIIGRSAANALNKSPGETIEISGSRFKIVGIYETGVGWENSGGVVSLRDGQILAGRPRVVTMASVKLTDPNSAELMVEKINASFPEVHASLSGEFAEQMPDMEAMQVMMDAMAFMAIAVGGIGIMNTMLMAVLERTREIGALRALGWKSAAILSMIMKESFLLGIVGGLLGIIFAVSLISLMMLFPAVNSVFSPIYTVIGFTKSILVSIILGILGGIYPALRASKMQPVEALRYE